MKGLASDGGDAAAFEEHVVALRVAPERLKPSAAAPAASPAERRGVFLRFRDQPWTPAVEAALLADAPPFVSSHASIGLLLPCMQPVLHTQAQRSAVAHAAAQRGCVRPRAGSIAAALESVPAESVDAAAASGDDVQLKQGAAARWAEYLDALIIGGVLPPTASGVPSVTRVSAWISRIAPSLETPDAAAKEGYKTISSLPSLVGALVMVLSLRGVDTSLKARAEWSALIAKLRTESGAETAVRTPPFFAGMADAACEMLSAGAPGWEFTGDLAATLRLDLVQSEVLLCVNTRHGRRNVSAAELLCGGVRFTLCSVLGHLIAHLSWVRNDKAPSEANIEGRVTDRSAVMKLIHMMRMRGFFLPQLARRGVALPGVSALRADGAVVCCRATRRHAGGGAFGQETARHDRRRGRGHRWPPRDRQRLPLRHAWRCRLRRRHPAWPGLGCAGSGRGASQGGVGPRAWALHSRREKLLSLHRRCAAGCCGAVPGAERR